MVAVELTATTSTLQRNPVRASCTRDVMEMATIFSALRTVNSIVEWKVHTSITHNINFDKCMIARGILLIEELYL